MAPSFLSCLCFSLCTSSLLSHASASAADSPQDDTLLWGPYRPNLYFGIRPRIPNSLMMGLLWARIDEPQEIQSLFRHTCEQHQLDGYGWKTYDPRTGGVQVLNDPANHINLTTSFVKLPDRLGGGWATRVHGKPRAGFSDTQTTLLFYAGLEGRGQLQVMNTPDTTGIAGPVTLRGQTPELGDFKLELRVGEGSQSPTVDHRAAEDKDLSRFFVKSFAVPVEYIWQATAVIFSSIRSTLDGYTKTYGENNMPGPALAFSVENEAGPGTFHAVQKMFKGEFEVDIIYDSKATADVISHKDITGQIKTVTANFEKKFSEIFQTQQPFTKPEYTQFSQSLLSNLLGGVGYFHGDSRVDRSGAVEYDEDGDRFWEDAATARARNEIEADDPRELFTSVPSRPFFPRGFLWDEGFHLMPIIDWDLDLAMEIVKSWFSLMDADGWIAREQILGAEARSKVPKEFQIQYPHYANPPTLFMIIDVFLDKLESHSASAKPPPSSPGFKLLTDASASRNYLKALYPLLQRNYEWFRSTQRGNLRSYPHAAMGPSTKEGYRWRGRTPTHVLTSGLDDYPRPQPPHVGELHADALTWVGVMARTLERVGRHLSPDGDGEHADQIAEHAGHLADIRTNLDALHWSADEKTWCDLAWLEEEEVAPSIDTTGDEVPTQIVMRPVDDGEESRKVCHKGYLSILPWLVGLETAPAPSASKAEAEAANAKIGAVLDLLQDAKQLWSEHGIRSLSKSDPMYGTEENYWRGPVWINMNYLAVLRLFELAQSPRSPHAVRAAGLYSRLRRNLVDTVYEAWAASGGGFAYEQYDPETGEGQRTEHFTGWTSLVVKIAAMEELEVQGGKVVVVVKDGGAEKGGVKGKDEL